MLKLKEIWIGEGLKLKSNQKVGTFEGIGAQNHAFVRIDGKMYLVEAKDLEIHSPSEKETELILEDDDATKLPTSLAFDNKLDLHIAILNPDIEHAEPTRILAYQVKAATNFIQEAIDRRQYTINIIHGKGKGQLKSEVHHILDGFKQVSHYQLINNGGATEVLLSYY